MRQLRFIAIGLFTFLFATSAVFLRKIIAFFLCGVLSFNSSVCYSFLNLDEVSNATALQTIHSIGVQKELISDNSQSNVSLAGKWRSDWGIVEFNSNLTGQWNQGVGIGQIIDGNYDPKTRKLVFHYYQPWNDMNGTATLTLSEDGSQLSGTWTQQKGSNPSGSGGSGGWTMTRDLVRPLPVSIVLPAPGDIVVYRLNGNITHSGVISQVGSDHKTIIKVISKWGSGSLYEHNPLDAPKSYGSWTAYHTARQGHNLLKSTDYFAKYKKYLTDKNRQVPALPDFYAWLTNKFAGRWNNYKTIKELILKMENSSGFSDMWLSTIFPTRILAFQLSGIPQKPTQSEMDEMGELEALSKRIKTLTPGPILSYDCHGYTFTNGDVWIGATDNHGEEVEIILKDNEYDIVPSLDTKGFSHPDVGTNNINQAT